MIVADVPDVPDVSAEWYRRIVVEGTVKSYVSTILSRSGVRNRVQAAILAPDAGLIPPGA